jgi:AAA ATPase domain
MDDQGHRTPERAIDDAHTLGDLIADRDRRRFVARGGELAFLERCLEDSPPAKVVLVHGPGGIGKSTLLREFARRAEESGWESHLVEGRELPPSPYALEAALEPSRDSLKPLILIDTYERMTALESYLRRELLPGLPSRTLVVIAGRAAPDAGWFQDGWEEVAAEIELSELDSAESLGLLQAHGVPDDRAPEIIEWAEGSPLALAIAAEAALADAGWHPDAGGGGAGVMRSLIRRLVDTELHGQLVSSLAVAAIARVTTRELLREVVLEGDADEAYERLQALTFTEPVGEGLALHELVRKILQADFRQHDPDRERELRRRIADHLYARAKRGDALIPIDLGHLVDSPTIRWGFGWEGSTDYRIDVVRPSDAERAGEVLTARGLSEWWKFSERFFTEAPERISAARDREDHFAGYAISMSPETAPDFAWKDPLLGPWLVHARAASHLGDSVLWRDSIDFTGDPRGWVQAMLGVAGILRSGASNPRFAYMPINPEMPSALSFARAMGATHVAELDLHTPDLKIECHRIDYGPGGLIAFQRAVIYGELGLPDPRGADAQRPTPDDVRAALRNFRVPHELANSPLARGSSPEERVESVRSVLRDAAQKAFGESENEKLLRRVLTRGYIDSESSHEQAADELNLSRAAYFRRLRQAAERVAEYLAQTTLE